MAERDLTAAAEELYALSPDAFTARRNELAKEAKGAGDKDLAARVGKLPKPSTAAWVVNMLVRHDPDQVDQVLTLGAALREAQENMAGEELRRLGRQRRQLTAAVTTQARVLAADLGTRVGDAVADQVEETLRAAMVDEGAAAAVRSAALVRPLSASGVEGAEITGAVALPELLGEHAVRFASLERPARRAAGAATPATVEEEQPAPPGLSVVPDETRELDEAEQHVAEAESAATGADKKLAKAERKVAKLEARTLQLQAELEELRRKAAEVEHRIETNDEELADAEERRDGRREIAEDLRRVLAEARERLDRLRS